MATAPAVPTEIVAYRPVLLPSPAVVAEAPADLVLDPIQGEARTLREWVTNFHLLVVAVDPYTNESSWILPTATRILEEFQGADVRVSWLVTADDDDARAFLGPLAERFLTFADPQRASVKALGLQRLPALVHIGTDLSVIGMAEGWHPTEWREICNRLTRLMSWGRVLIPHRGDPAPFEGSPALG